MRRIAYGAAAAVALLVLTQVVLPPVAEQRVRDGVQRRGATVTAVDVAAFPAVKLLWGRADRVRLGIGSARLGGPGDLASELARTRDVGRVDATVTALHLGPLTLRDVQLRKRARRLLGEASVTRADLAAALPVDLGLRAVAAGDGELVLEASAGPLTVRARLSARAGTLVIAPEGLLGGFATLTLFDDPRVLVDGVGARSRPDGFTVTAAGHLR